MAGARADRAPAPGGRVGPWCLAAAVGPSTWLAVDDSGADLVVRIAAPGTAAADAVRAEAAALSIVRRPGLAELAGTFEAAGVVAVATRRVEGPTLVGLGLPWPAVAAVLAPVADALAALHHEGWIHGDVAAANVVVTPAGGVLVDLGCARPAAAAGATGTPGSTAPEVVAGSSVTPAAEVWSLAAVASAALTGAPPAATIALRRALADDPADRPSVADLAAVLAHAAGTVDVEPRPVAAVDPRSATTYDYGPRPPAPPAPPPSPPGRAGPLVAAVAVVATVTACVLASLRPTGADVAPPPADCPPVPAGSLLVGDPDGDGCDTVAAWAGGVLVVALRPGSEPSRVALGAPGDVVALGDWDCDGVDTPASYRPSTGTVTRWDAWPTAATPAAPALVRTDVAGATAAVEPDGPCDRFVVRRSF